MNPTTNIDFSQSLASSTTPHMPPPSSQSSKPKVENEAKDPIVARKVQKADREKLRRDRLNEQFLELGSALDPDRPKNDKATILTDTIQMLKDLTAEVSRLKVEYTALSEESRELMQEKNELREEKASLKTDIDNLKVQYQQTLRATFPWAGVDPSVVVGPTYSYTIPVPVPSGLIPAHPFPFFGNQNPGAIPGPYATSIPYPAHANLPNGHASNPCASSSNISIKRDFRRKSAEYLTAERCDGSNDVATELELKMPGSSAQQDSSTGEKKSKQSQRKEGNVTPGSTSSRYSSSQGIQDSSSNSVGDVPRSNNC